MLAALEQWKSLSRDNLFDFWKKERLLKKEISQQLSDYRSVQIENEAEYNFLRHSLVYSGNKNTFYTIIFFNMNRLPVQSAWLNSPAELRQDFLGFLPEIIRREKPSPPNLQFLINIYREDLELFYKAIVKELNQPDCDYLLGKTASKPLRKLLQDRQAEINKLVENENYGLTWLKNETEYPGIYGDKLAIIHQAVLKIQGLLKNDWTDQAHYFKACLNTADQLFTAGLLNDSLALLTAVYEHSTLQSDYADNKVLYNLINKVVPVYALLDKPTKACSHALNIYQALFPGMAADNNSIYYLKLYQYLIANRQGNPQYTLTELLEISRPMVKQAGNPLAGLLHNLAGVCIDDLILDLVNPTGDSGNHQLFVTLEILRFLGENQILSFSPSISSALLKEYLNLFEWIPSSLFLNDSIRKQLANLADEDLLSRVDNILKVKNKYSPTDLKENYILIPEISADSQNNILKQLVLGSFLGVF